MNDFEFCEHHADPEGYTHGLNLCPFCILEATRDEYALGLLKRVEIAVMHVRTEANGLARHRDGATWIACADRVFKSLDRIRTDFQEDMDDADY